MSLLENFLLYAELMLLALDELLFSPKVALVVGVFLPIGIFYLGE
jgi:hypothetical protein